VPADPTGDDGARAPDCDDALPRDDGAAPDDTPPETRKAAPPAPPAAAHERRVALQVGDLFGVDVRPSRTFVWLGRRRAGQEAIVSLGGPPSVPRRALEERTKQVGATEITYAGSPAVTVPLTAYRAAREVLRRRAARRDATKR
jgi:hypothetical protein